MAHASIEPSANTPIAIVGIGCRFPGGVSTPAGLVDFLRLHGDGICEVPPDRYARHLHHDPEDAPGKVYVTRGGYLTQDLFSFDPAPFGISPREASYMDPQQRLLLEVAWESFEDAGIPVDTLRGSRTGVYVGGFTLDMQALSLHPDNRHLVSQHTSTGVTMTVLSSRLAYTFDLRGPCLTVDTACSSSLVATHLACQAIREGACDRALVGGVNAIVSLGYTLVMCKGHFLSPDGRCKAFDAAANGYGRGEGAGVVLLEPLDRALAEGHRVYAVIHGSTINHDGRTDGMAMPNEEAQAAASREVCVRAGVDPAQVAYVEAHGTGTRAGDPVEARALGEVYGRDRAHPLYVGSIKTNVGHLEAAAGVAGLIKAALCVHQGEILPQRPLMQPNPDIPFDALGLEVAQAALPWPTADGPRLAAINSFGYGGTNAHVLLGSCEPSNQQAATAVPRSGPLSFALSAASPDSLASAAANLRDTVSQADAPSLEDVAFTLGRLRTHAAERAVVLASDPQELMVGLERVASGAADPAVVRGSAPENRRCVWVFTGMGPQWWGMGRELFADEPVFRRAVEEVDDAFVSRSGSSVLAEMLRDESESRMARNVVAQPANFVLQVGLVAMLRDRGLVADAYLGHSVGEVAAAWASGALDLQQAVLVAHHRSRLQQRVAGQGTMLAAAVSADEARALVPAGADVVIAAFNAPRSVALAGNRTDLEAIAAVLEAEGTFHRFMPVEVAYHSPHMDPLEHDFLTLLAELRPLAPRAPLYSTLLGARVTDDVHDATYWWRNAREPVLLHRAVRAAIDDGHSLFVEVGPHPVLGTAIRDVLAESGTEGQTFFTLRRQQPEQESVLRNVAGLHAAGATLDWADAIPNGQRSDLPRYAFARQRLWVESRAALEDRLGRARAHPLLQRDGHGPSPRWTTDLTVPELRWVRDHRVDGSVVFPGAAYLEALVAASAEQRGEDVEHVVEDVELVAPLVLAQEGVTRLSVELDARGGVRVDARVDEGDWVEHARGRLADRARYGQPAARGVTTAASEVVDPEAHYERLATLGLEYGEGFRTIVELGRSGEHVHGTLRTPDAAERWWLHPTLVDGAFQALLALLPEDEVLEPTVPTRIGRLRVRRRLGSTVHFEGHATRRPDGGLQGRIAFYDDRGEMLAELVEVICRPIRPKGVTSSWFHLDRFEPVELGDHAPTGRWAIIGAGKLADALVDALSSSNEVVVAETIEQLDALEHFDVVVVLPPDEDPGDPCELAALEAVLAAVRRLSGDSGVRLRVVTKDAFELGTGSVRPEATAIAGLMRVAMTEHPALMPTLVDIPARGTTPARELVEALAQTQEEELCVRDGIWYARRIVRCGERNEARRSMREQVPAARGRFGLVATRSGDLSSLIYRPRPMPAPSGDEIEVEVEVASLNFKDVMKAMGMLSETALAATYFGDEIGMEAVGRVVRVGPQVRGVAVGERVHALCPGAIASVLRVREPYVLPCRDGDDPVHAASDFVFTTAWYALLHRARLQPGDRLLVHSAAGGVGLAALQIAKRVGARVFATAGTEAKRAFLRGQGIRHVYDSRTLDFVDAIRRDTDGEGVDVVLNALAGPALVASLGLLAEGGRFVELGKQDIAADTTLPMLAFNRSLSFLAIDLDRMSARREDLYRPLAQEVSSAFAAGELRPLPTEAYPADRAHEAFRRLASGDVIGKVVLDFRETVLPVAPGFSPRPPVRSDRTYLVTGGLGGFGLRTARWLVDRGARHLVLASRRGRPAPEDERMVDALRQRGAQVGCATLDVCDGTAVHELIAELATGAAPLAGVFHAAMVLDDRPLAEIDEAALRRVLAPKAWGAWHLHEATAGLELDHFVMYGSVSALVGNPAQGAYAAANAYLDGLAAHRRGMGLPALAVSWGALAEVGVVARDETIERHLRSLGLEPLPPGRALEALGRAMDEDFGRVGIIDIDWARWVRAHAETAWRRLEPVAGAGEAGSGGPGERLRSALRGLDASARAATVLQALREATGRVFRLAPDQIDSARPLQSLGLDSLMAVELQVSIEDATGVELSSMELLAGPPLDKLVPRVLDRLEVESDPTSQPAPRRAASAKRDETETLRARFLEQICVQPPYFALEDMAVEGEWVRAEVEPVPPAPCERAFVGVAETARHLAIVGSCAVRRAMGGEGRIYYPVERARMLEGRAPTREAQALTRVEVRARCQHVDTRASKAWALTELWTPSGELLARFEMGYHVIEAAQFETLFAAHARPTREGRAPDPYRLDRTLGSVVFDGESATVELGIIEPDACLGHFVGYPAYPVSIMARDAVAAVASAVRQRSGQSVQIAVTGGEAGTHRFVFAGRDARVVARPIDTPANADEAWRATIESEGETAAWFDMHLRVFG